MIKRVEFWDQNELLGVKVFSTNYHDTLDEAIADMKCRFDEIGQNYRIVVIDDKP